MWNKFLEKIAGANTVRETGVIINALFSEYEKSIITKRLAALALIRSGVGVRDISRALWMSTGTIGVLKKNFFGDQKAYKSQRSLKATKKESPKNILFSKKSWMDDLFGNIDLLELLKNPPRPRGLGVTGDRW